jgi:hypothetical protein
MQMNWTVVTLVIACCSITVSAALLFGDRFEAEGNVKVGANAVDIPQIPATVAPSPPPPPPSRETSAPVPEPAPVDSTPQLVQLNGITILHQRVPLLDLGPMGDRYHLVPGAHFPGLQGLYLSDAVRLVMTSFPMLTVKAVMIGEPLHYQFRRDRLTIQYDPFTKRVVSTRIG